MASKVSGIIEKINSDGISYAIASTAYGVCETAADIAAKTVEMTGFKLFEGVTVHIKFNENNSADNPTLNINGTGAWPMVLHGTTAMSTSNATTGWYAGSVVSFTFTVVDSTHKYWVRDQGFNTNSDTYTSAYCGTSASTVAKVASCTYWTATANSYIHINFRYTNTAANPTLNISSTGAKPIYVDGAAATTSNLKAGSYIAFYDGTNYQLRTDGKLPGLGIIGDAATVNGHTVAKDVPSNAVFTDTWNALSTSQAGYVSQAPNDTTKFLRGDSNWSVLPSASDSVAGIVKLGASGGAATFEHTHTPGELGLAPALRFIGITTTDMSVTNNTHDDSVHTYTGVPTITDYTTPAIGDVVINSTYQDEWVCISINDSTTPVTYTWERLGADTSYKIVQTAVSDPNLTDTTSTTFISSITQNENGIISPVKKKLPTLTNVSYTNTTDSNNEYPVLFKKSTGTATTAAGVRFISADNKSVTINGSTGKLTALAGFIGNLEGNASTATSWAAAQTAYVDLSTAGTDSTINGGQNSAQVLKVNGTLDVENGGTGKSQWVQWGIVYADSTTTLSQVTAGASGNSGQVLISKGAAAPGWYGGLTLTGTQASDWKLSFAGETDASATTAAVTIDGGLGVAKKLYVGTQAVIGKIKISTGTSDSASRTIEVTEKNLIINGLSNYGVVFQQAHANKIKLMGDTFFPDQTNNGTLGLGGNDPKRWSAIYVGTADTYGDPALPIYWNDGVPTYVDGVLQKKNFTIASGETSVTLEDAAYNQLYGIETYVMQIVVTEGEEYLNDVISWTSRQKTGSTTLGEVVLSCDVATSGIVSGYILTARGANLDANNSGTTNDDPGSGSEDPPVSEEP